MDKVTLSTIALLALTVAIFLINIGHTKLVKKVALLLLGLAAVLWATG